MEDDRIEDDITLNRTRGTGKSASWSNRNMIATQPVQFMREPPTLKARRVEDRFAQVERARLRVTKAYMDNPEFIGKQWALIWRARSQQAAQAVYQVMVHDMFRPYPEDRYRWFLRRRKTEIWGLLVLRREEEWDEETRAIVDEFQSNSKRSVHFDDAVNEEKNGGFTEQDPLDVIEGLNHQQKDRYKKGHR